MTLIEKNDFSERLSPILVRELRQGLRSRVFIAVFMIVQLALLVFALSTWDTVEEHSHYRGPELAHIFWFLQGCYLLFILPLMATRSIHKEFTEGKLEMLLLTRLNSRRIVYGKWLAIMCQALLIISATLPYIVMRYYAGGVEFISELKTLSILLLMSMALVAAGVAISSIRSRIFRMLLVIGFVFGAMSLPSLLFSILAFGGSPMGGSTTLETWQIYLLIIAIVIPLVLIILEWTAGRISPLAENHDTPKRLLAYLILAEALSVSLISNDKGITVFFFILCLIIFPCLIIDSLASPALSAPILYRPFLRLGSLGRIPARLLLYPGWPAAVTSSIVILTGLAVLSQILNNITPSDPIDAPLLIVGIISCIFTPYMIIKFLKVKHENQAKYYIFTLTGIIVCTILFMIVIDDDLFLISPLGIIILALNTSEINTAHRLFEYYFAFYTIIAACGLIPLLIGAIRSWKIYTEGERRAQALIQPSKKPTVNGD